MRAAANPFRHVLLAGTVCHTPEAHKMAGNIARLGGWPVVLATDRAKQAGQDTRSAMQTARRQVAEDIIRLRTRCIPRTGTVADIVRWDDLPPNP